jgi:hypothetical protein
MKYRIGLLIVGCALVLQAQMQMNVDQLVQFIRSELALKQHTDKQVAAYVKKLQLTEKLTDKTILDLEAQGAGPKTVQAMQELRDRTAAMKSPTHDATYSPATAPDTLAVGTGTPTATLQTKLPPIPPPNSIEQQKILGMMKEYALNYTENLPNFICVQVTRRYIDPNASDHYRSIGTVLAKVSYNGGRENYKVYSVNGQFQDTDMEHVKAGGAISSGEFGSLMREIFEPSGEADFGWDHWATLRGRKMAVFNYFIDSGHSKYSIDYLGGPGDEQRIITAYKGLIYADPSTGEIDRIKFVAVDIPRNFPVSEATEILDYDLVDISGQKYVCPLLARLYMTAGREKSRNEIEFRDYRKFGTESQIEYGAEAPPPLPESQTQEQPAAFSSTTTAPVPGAAASTGSRQSAKPAGSTAESGSSNPWALPTPPPPPPQ